MTDNRESPWFELIEWHPLKASRTRQLLLGNGALGWAWLFLLAFYWFPIPETDGRWNVSKAFRAYCWHARTAALASAAPLYFHLLGAYAAADSLFFNVARQAPRTEPFNGFIDTYLFMLDQPAEVALVKTFGTWLLAQIALRTLMKIYFHLKPAAEATSG